MSIYLLSSNSEDGAFFEGAAKAAKLSLETLTDAEQACDVMQKGGPSVFIVDASTPEMYGAFEKSVTEKIGLYSDALNVNRMFYVSSSAFHEVPYLVKSEIFGHFIHRSFSRENQDLIGRVLLSASSDQVFGIERYFVGQIRAQTIPIKQSLQKKAIVESLKGHLVKIGFKSRMAALMATATDELIMNAIFDAPVDELGKHLHAQTPRNAAFELLAKNEVEMKVAFDGHTLGISVLDHHGSLDKKKLLSQHVGRSYQKSDYETKTSTVGAGLGLAHVYRNCGGILFSCEVGGKTEVCLFYKKTDSFKDFKDQFRFLSTFTYFSP